MAISLRACGSWASTTGVSSLAITLPTHAAGDMLIVRAACKPYTSVITCATSGWAAVATGFANGATDNGNGVGSVMHRAFWKIATSDAEPDPTIDFSVTCNPGFGVALSYQHGADEAFITPVGDGGGDATLRTSQTCTIQSHVAVAAGDMVDFFLAWGDNYASTSPTITQTGVTYATVSEQPATALSTSDGFDGAADGGYRLASSGTSSAAAVVTATFGNSEQGGAWQTRLRVGTAKTATAGLASVTAAASQPAASVQPVAGLAAVSTATTWAGGGGGGGPTVAFTCGAECAALAHWTSITATATRSTSFYRSGAASIKIAAAGAAAYAKYTATANMWVVRLAIYFPTSLPAADCTLFELFSTSNNSVGLAFDQTTSKLVVAEQGLWTTRVPGPVVAADTWYVVDLKFDYTVGCPTINWKVGGAAQTAYANTGAAGNWNTASVGQPDTDIRALTTYTAYFDDLVISNTAGDYPIADGSVVAGETWVPATDPTHIFVCGAECDLTHWTTKAYCTADGTYKRNGSYGIHIHTAAQVGYASYSYTAASTAVARVSFYLTNEPTNIRLVDFYLTTAAENYYLRVDSNHKLRFGHSTVYQVTTDNFATGTWYTVDFKLNLTDNPHLLDWKVNGSAQTQVSVPIAADTIERFRLGDASASSTMEGWWDDACLSTTPGDYPITDGYASGATEDWVIVGGTAGATANVQPNAGLAAVTPAATDVQFASSKIAPAELATVAVSAYQTAFQYAPAPAATVAVAASQPAAKVAPNAGLASVAVAAGAAVGSVAPNAGAASVAAGAYAPAVGVSPNAAAANVAVAVPAATPSVAPSAGIAAVGVAVATTSDGVTPNAELATVAVAATDVSFAAHAGLAQVVVSATDVSFAAPAGLAQVTVSAHQTAMQYAPATTAAVVVAAHQTAMQYAPAPTATVAVAATDVSFAAQAGLATVAVSAHQTAMQYAPATTAAVSVAASQPAAKVQPSAGAAAVSITAQSTAAQVIAYAGLATVAVGASGASISVAAPAGLAAVSAASTAGVGSLGAQAPTGTVSAAAQAAASAIAANAGLSTVAVGATNVLFGAPAGLASVSATAYDVSFGKIAYAEIANVAVLARSAQGVGETGRRPHMPVKLPDQSIVAKSLFEDLKKRYGQERGMEVYLNMAEDRKGPFGEGKKYDPDRSPR